MSMDLHFNPINTLCTAAPGFSRGVMQKCFPSTVSRVLPLRVMGIVCTQSYLLIRKESIQVRCVSVFLAQYVLQGWWWSWPSADNRCLFYGLLPSCSVWAINLSPAISKQCSNQWEIISANRWARLSVPPSVYLSCCPPVCIPFPPYTHPPPTLLLLIPSVSFLLCLCFFHPLPLPQPPLTCISSSSLSSAAPILKCDSSAAPLTKVAFTHGACHITGLTFLLNMRVELVVKPSVCAPCCRPWFSVPSCIKRCYFSIFRFRVYFNRFTKLPLLKLSD